MPTRKWGSEILVNTTLTGNQLNVKVAALAGGGMAVVWQDDSSGNNAVKAQILDDTGKSVGGEFPIADFAGFNYILPDVTGLADGSFYVTAIDSVAGGPDNLVGSIWGSDGSLIRSQHPTLGTGNIYESDVAGLGTGSLAIWTQVDSGNNGELLFRIFDAAGNGANPVSVFHLGLNLILPNPSVDSRAMGDRFAIVVIANNNVVATLYNANGAALFNGVQVDDVLGGNVTSENSPKVKWLNNAEFAVAWTEHDPVSDGLDQIKVRIFDGEGAVPVALTGVISVNSTIGGYQDTPDITVLPNGGFVVSWTDWAQTWGDTSGASVHLQAFDGSGGKIGGEILVNTAVNSDQSRPSIAALDDGRVVVSWTDYSSGTSDIRMQIIDPRDGIVTGTMAGDTLYGNDAVGDEISGLDGADTLYGLRGNDVIYGGAGADLAFGGGSDDTLYGGSGNDDLRGNSGEDALFGEDGDDVLHGGNGADDLSGGAGSDTADYSEAPSGITASLDGSLAAKGFAEGDTYSSIENLTGTGFADTLAGNSGGNTITGGDGKDRIDGKAGSDTLIGGNGADIMTGGAGNDTFRFTATSDVGNVIKDFSSNAVGNDDTLAFASAAFGGLAPGAIQANQFQSSIDANAATPEARFIFETDTGILRFDADGNGAGAAIVIATLLAGATLTAADIVIF